MVIHAARLRALGHEVVSTWHDDDTADDHTTDHDEWQRRAERCFGEIMDVDCFLSFTETPADIARGGFEFTRGGRHVELGYAIGTAKHACVIGPRENVGHHALGVPRFETLEEAVQNRFGLEVTP